MRCFASTLTLLKLLELLCTSGADETVDAVAALEEKQIEALIYNKARLEARVAQLEERAQQRRLQVTNTVAFSAASDVLDEAVTKIGVLAVCLDYMWLLISGALVMFMQAGFAMLEAGCVRSKNGGMVLTKNILDVCLGTLVWYFWGYGLAYGTQEDQTPNEHYGNGNWAGQGFLTTDANGRINGTGHFKDWFFQWAFCATSATIVSGGVAERIRLPAYALYSVVMTGFIYPIVVWWTWSGYGWLTLNGYSDFAGSGIVHLTGGASALIGTAVLGPRQGRWDSHPDRFAPHNVSLVALGTFILWFGWYGFNGGSTLTFSDVGTATQAGLVAVNTTIAASFGGLTVLVLRMRSKHYDLAGTCNGILAGLVAVSAGCGDMMPHYALLTGIIGAVAYELGVTWEQSIGIDDPLDAFAVHGCAGIAGVLTRPLFDRRGPQMNMWGWHIMAVLSIAAFSGGCTFICFFFLRVLGVLRIPDEEEKTGGDVHLSPRQMYVLDEYDAMKSHVYDAVNTNYEYGLDLTATGGRMEYMLRDMEESCKSKIRSTFGIAETGTKNGLFKKEDYIPKPIVRKPKPPPGPPLDGTSIGERLEAFLQSISRR